MRKIALGRNGPLVSAQGLGCMGMSIFYGTPDDESSIQTIHKAVDLGVNLIVTSDAYGKGKNEERIASLENMVQELTARLSTFDALVAQVSALEQRLASMGVAYAVEMPAAPVAGGVGDDMMNRS